MTDEYIRLIDLPPTVNGLITIDNDGNYNIYINARLSHEEQLVALRHELTHAKENHLLSDITAREAEDHLILAMRPQSSVIRHPKAQNAKMGQNSAPYRHIQIT